MSETRYFRVSGTVQGVGFRVATQQTARRLSLAGWVRNRADGDVELVAAGKPRALDELTDWLHAGPAAARVTHVAVETGAPASSPDLADPFAVI
ncbi:acylphosphatase [Salinisphaera sp. Q1T1-3]|uniref:acylphosphatase n=1 Tax=Salinisphaera sp. Q1T1-3 TaxID=2321229 RepID=UPI000E74DA99|nr:acylphosphatase [Salinisphaera sp. Q1T1-3]RJS92959.1 acylphosphatase [Salinisphaera sp. Q1T1-3]